MQWEEFRHKRVGLIGAGQENLSLIPHLVKVEAVVFVCDQWDSAIPENFRHRFPTVKLVIGSDHLKSLGSYDYIFRSPGIPVATIDAALNGVKEPPIRTSVTDLFLSMTPSTVVGVTGTKGKGTTSTMIGAILAAASKKAVVAGNIGKPIFTLVDELDEQTIVVLELSSFQLEDCQHSPQIAVILPITEDHLQPLSDRSPNFHPSINDYVAAKAQITVNQTPNDTLVFAADNEQSAGIASVSRAKKIAVSQTAYQAHWNVDHHGRVYQDGEPFLELKDSGLRGNHLFLNATMAMAACAELGVDKSAMSQGLKEFKPLPHRMELVKTVDGVQYVDDSFATAPDATLAALSAFESPIVLILGGSSKGVDFKPLAEAIAKSGQVKAVVTLGEEGPRIAAALSEAVPTLPISQGSRSMAEVVKRARELARRGDVVLLSPACASTDMFKNATDRGEQFKQAI